MKITNVLILMILGSLIAFSGCTMEPPADEEEEEDPAAMEEAIEDDDEQEMTEEEKDLKDEIVEKYEERISDVRMDVQELEQFLSEQDTEVRNRYVENTEWMNETLQRVNRDLGALHFATEEELRQRDEEFGKTLDQVEEQIDQIYEAIGE